MSPENTNKTDRVQTQLSFSASSNLQKKTFTPKCSSKAIIDEPGNSNKIIASYSSTDLLKLNNVSSPTC